jgi:hypothetical protein
MQYCTATRGHMVQSQLPQMQQEGPQQAIQSGTITDKVSKLYSVAVPKGVYAQGIFNRSRNHTQSCTVTTKASNPTDHTELPMQYCTATRGHMVQSQLPRLQQECSNTLQPSQSNPISEALSQLN